MVKKHTLRAIITLAFSSLIGHGFAQTPDFIASDIDTYIKKGMQQWQVPALAIVIVKDGQVVKMQGFGVRDITSNTAVDEHTLFNIASNTKLFTGTALANLEYQKRINLNDKITQYFPDFRLYDSVSTQLVSVRDMLTHRIGTKTFQGDFTFWNSTLTSSQIMQKMRLLQPSQVFRQDYGYCNSCYLTAGEVVPVVTGISWGNYVQDSILNKLRMTESFALSNAVHTQQQNMAVPYTTSYSGQLKVVPYDQWDNLGPAASIVSNVSDLSHWLMMQLDSGKYKGNQVLPWQVLQRTRQVNIITGSNKSPVFPMHFRGYALGLSAADYNGRQIYWHTGGAAGMVSNVCFVPEEQLGIAILTSNDNQNFFEALRYQILDAYLGVPYVNRSEQFLPAFEQELKTQLAEIKAWESRQKNHKPPLPVKAYTGSYHNPLYGDINLKSSGDNQLTIELPLHPNMQAVATYLDNDEWLLKYTNIEYGIFTIKFQYHNRQVEKFALPANPFVEMDAYEFQKTN